MSNLAHLPLDLATKPDVEPNGKVTIDLEKFKEQLGNQWWRLNNLYRILDKEGRSVPFTPNWAQKAFYERMWYGNIILKARQLGFSTFIEIMLLDYCLFVNDFNAVVIAHGKEEASALFQQKILYAYNNLPDELRQLRKATALSKTGLQLNNNSQIRVVTSARSGTFQAIHISEFGKICAKYPARADEIVSGSLPAIHEGSLLFVESTAEGESGHFYKMCKTAENLALLGKKPRKADNRFFFFAWHQHKGYRLNAEDTLRTLIPKRLVEYFYRLEVDYGIELDQFQRAWYAKNEETYGPLMRREYPSHPKEAFAADIEGAYYGQHVDRVRMEGRLTRVPIQDGIPVDTWWDLGIDDYCVIVLAQTVGREIHIVDWYMNNNYGVEHYAEYLNQLAIDRRFVYGTHFVPHDAGQREIGTGKTRKQIAAEYGLKWKIVPRTNNVMNDIDRVRVAFANLWFDEEHCDGLLGHLGQYRKEWDKNLGAFKKTPLHNEHSHPADAVRTGIRLHPVVAKFNAALENGLESVASENPNDPMGIVNRPAFSRTR